MKFLSNVEVSKVAGGNSCWLVRDCYFDTEKKVVQGGDGFSYSSICPELYPAKVGATTDGLTVISMEKYDTSLNGEKGDAGVLYHARVRKNICQ